MPLLHGKQALLVTGFLVFFVFFVDPIIAARLLKMDNGGGVADNAGRPLLAAHSRHENDSTVLTPSAGSDDNYQLYQAAGDDLVDEDCTAARKKTPIHN
ncbi:hypothetical protein C5167_037045 [Papaver somniferum]|uniref:Uncharacterized protein n=1 Tax=Papaver somniferum TaxID=3469 RepID=A0A4Y7I7U4_PAPSO|nr:uncharacterized protein LOC113327727 isoform X2 [Papaver somniferum]RZC44096.1 hypothetical protein C5167_037045 [Papaver somniferum]